MATDSDGEHRGKGHAAYTESQAVDFIKEQGIAVTSELAEEFGVTDVAIRKRLKDSGRIGSRKVRNRRVWYVPHDPPTVESDGYGAVSGRTFGVSAFLTIKAALPIAVLGLILSALSLVFNSFRLMGVALILYGLAFILYRSADKFSDEIDPGMRMKDVYNTLREDR